MATEILPKKGRTNIDYPYRKNEKQHCKYSINTLEYQGYNQKIIWI